MLTKPIPINIREELNDDPFMHSCCVKEFIPHICIGKIDWHHNLIVAGKRSNIKESILPVCQYIHNKEKNTEVHEILDCIMIFIRH